MPEVGPPQLVGTLRPDDVTRVRFGATRLFTPGYDERSVDEFLDEVAQKLRLRWTVVDLGPGEAPKYTRPTFSLTAAQVREQYLPMTKFRQGYRPEEVQELLERVATSMDRIDAYLRGFRYAD